MIIIKIFFENLNVGSTVLFHVPLPLQRSLSLLPVALVSWPDQTNRPFFLLNFLLPISQKRANTPSLATFSIFKTETSRNPPQPYRSAVHRRWPPTSSSAPALCLISPHCPPTPLRGPRGRSDWRRPVPDWGNAPGQRQCSA